MIKIETSGELKGSMSMRFSEAIDTMQIVVGNDVFDLLTSEDFLERWDLLYASCPWATIFQKREFVIPWYNTNRFKHLPILIKEEYEGRLVGLFLLAKNFSGSIGGAGLDLAEYQVWLSTVDNGTQFFKSAISLIKEKFDKTDIRLRFITSDVPLDWCKGSTFWKKRCLVQDYSQPTIDLQKFDPIKKINSKDYRIKVNRLKRSGELKFERIVCEHSFLIMFDELFAQYDLRKGALYNNKVKFSNSLEHKRFLLELLRSNILHVTILKLNEEVIAFHAGFITGKCFHLGLSGQNPTYSKYSPGLLHLLKLTKMLQDEGFAVFDLTPGGDAYKNGFAMRYAKVKDLCIASNLISYAKNLVGKLFYDSILKHKESTFLLLSRLGINSTHLRNKIKKILRTARAAKEKVVASNKVEMFSFSALYRLLQSKKIKLYQLKSQNFIGGIAIQRNSLHDLLKFNPEKSDLTTKCEFYMQAIQRFEAGYQCFSIAKNNCLLSCVWVGRLKTAEIKNGFKNLSVNLEDSIALKDMYCHAKGIVHLEAFLSSVVNRVSSTNSVMSIYALVDVGNIVQYKVFKKTGFDEVKEIKNSTLI